MIQAIKCKGGKIFAGCIEPECYTDREWMKELRSYVEKYGCTVSLIDRGTFNLESCICGVRNKEKNCESLKPNLFSKVMPIEPEVQRSVATKLSSEQNAGKQIR